MKNIHSKAAVVALLCALSVSCADKEATDKLEPAVDPGDLDAVEIESETEAYDRASEEIHLDNWENELEKLEQEIDSDPYTEDGG